MSDVDLRAAVVREAMTWHGTPYHHHGRIKGVGVDCLMLLAEVFEACGVVRRVEPGVYAHDWHLHQRDELYERGLANYARRLPDGEDPQPGDIGVFRFGKTYSHGCIVVDEGPLLIHAYLGLGVVMGRVDEAPLAGRLVHWWSVF
jgi:NlpC/P60 family putative phage cell wall peptidase